MYHLPGCVSEKGNMNKHIVSVHEKVKLFECSIWVPSICRMNLSDRGNLNNHFNALHEEKCTIFKCSLCDTSYKKKDSLNYCGHAGMSK